MHLKIRTKDIALIAIYAALYVALVVVLGPFSYGPIQIRVADSLLAACPITWFSRGFRSHTWSIRWQHILNCRSNRLAQHYTFVCNVIRCLLRLQTQ